MRKVLEVRNNHEMKMLRNIGIVTVSAYSLFFEFALLKLLRHAIRLYGVAFRYSSHSALLPLLH